MLKQIFTLGSGATGGFAIGLLCDAIDVSLLKDWPASLVPSLVTLCIILGILACQSWEK